MKHLLNGVAVAAVMALAMPAFAQNAPMAPSTPPKAPAPATTQTQTPAPAPKAPAPTTAMKPMHHMVMHHHYRGVGEGDRMTEQLNQQELQRIQSGAPPSAPMPAAMPSNYQTPGKSDMPPMAAPPPPAR